MVGGTVLVSNAVASGPDRDNGLSVLWHTPPADVEEPRTPAPEPMVEPPDPDPSPRPDLDADVTVPVDGFVTWAALDRATGDLAGDGAERSTTESMIKPWIAADHLRRFDEQGQDPSAEELALARAAIRDSDDEAAERLYVAGGNDAVVERMIERCGLTETEVHSFWWSRTQMTARDAVLMGECLANGTAAGEDWTEWILNEMRAVRGSVIQQDPERGLAGGRWGIIDGLPDSVEPDGVAIKNGWTRIGETGSWHVNCLAVNPDWVIAVMMQFPAEYELDYGAERCASVASQLFSGSAAAG